MADVHYRPAAGTICFRPGISHVSIPIGIIVGDVGIQADDEDASISFVVSLGNQRVLDASSSAPERTTSAASVTSTRGARDEAFVVSSDGVAGVHSECRVTIAVDPNEHRPGIIEFHARQITINESRGWVEIQLLRGSGTRGRVSVDVRTADGSAVDGIDYEAKCGTITFEDGEREQSFYVRIIDDSAPEFDTDFYVHMENARGGCKLGANVLSTVRIIDDDTIDRLRGEIKRQLQTRLELVRLQDSRSWRKQFIDAVSLQPDASEGGPTEPPTAVDALYHFLTINWKVLFALVPPVDRGYGFPAFFASLFFIGLLTSLVGEFAGLFGCSIGLKEPITAISFVALGTSLPDTFASYLAARDGDDADAAIGNIMGSNSVNVFLGQGVPWIIASLYYAYFNSDTGGKYCVPTSSLVYSVMIFAIFASACFVLLLWRRARVGGELGGDFRVKMASFAFLLCLYLSYVVLSALKTEGHIQFGTDGLYDKFGCAIGRR